MYVRSHWSATTVCVHFLDKKSRKRYYLSLSLVPLWTSVLQIGELVGFIISYIREINLNSNIKQSFFALSCLPVFSCLEGCFHMQCIAEFLVLKYSFKGSLDRWLQLLRASVLTKKDLILLAISIAIPLSAAAIGSLFTFESISTWYQTIEKPWFTPPSWVFGPAWTLLYILMGVALFAVWRTDGNREAKKIAFTTFSAQLFLNVLWSYLFFGLRSPQFAFVEIMVLLAAIAVTIVAFSKISKLAAVLMLPYGGWVTFASLLNLQVWLLNS
jgi:translocator protein